MKSLISTRCSMNRQPASRLLVDAVENAAADVVSVLTQQPGTLAAQAVCDRQ